MLDHGIWENDRQIYPAGTPIPWSDVERLHLESKSAGGGGVIGAPPPAHSTRPGVVTRPSPSKTGPHPRPDKKAK